jgi:hypothetical protein
MTLGEFRSPRQSFIFPLTSAVLPLIRLYHVVLASHINWKNKIKTDHLKMKKNSGSKSVSRKNGIGMGRHLAIWMHPRFSLREPKVFPHTETILPNPKNLLEIFHQIPGVHLEASTWDFSSIFHHMMIRSCQQIWTFISLNAEIAINRTECQMFSPTERQVDVLCMSQVESSPSRMESRQCGHPLGVAAC